MFYGVKFVYVNLQTDGQAIWQKSKKLLYKITELEKSKNLCNRHNQVGQIIIPNAFVSPAKHGRHLGIMSLSAY